MKVSNVLIEPIGDTPPMVKPVISLTLVAFAILRSLTSLIFFNLFNEHLLSPDIKHKKNVLSFLKTKLFTIAPISHFNDLEASNAV